MALAKMSREIISIRGRFGGVYFKHDNKGQHVQAMPRSIRYAKSGIQGERRTQFSTMAAIWMLALLGFYAALWAAFALANWWINTEGQKKHITGYMWFIHFAMMFPEEQRPPFWIPPHAPGVYPQYMVTWRGRWTYNHEPGEWPKEAPTGYYWESYEYNGKSSYKTDDDNWFLWWQDPTWVLSTFLGGEIPPDVYYGPVGEIIGKYTNPVTGSWADVYIGGG